MEKVVVAHRSRYSSRVRAALQLEAPCKQLAQALAAHTSDKRFQHPERVFWTIKTLLSNLSYSFWFGKARRFPEACAGCVAEEEVCGAG